MLSDPEIHDLAAAYALDALDAEERRTFEAHVDRCQRCRDDIASFGPAVLSLALAAEGAEPPAGLRERILADARADQSIHAQPEPEPEPPSKVVWLGAARDRRELASRFLRPRVLGGAFAVAAAAAVALAVWGSTISGSLDRERSARQAEAAALAAFADPSAVHVSAGTAALAVAGGRAALSVAKLPPAPGGKTYEAWVIPPGKPPIPAGTFDSRGGRGVVLLKAPVHRGATVAVTVEKAGGAKVPTGKPVVALRTPLA